MTMQCMDFELTMLFVINGMEQKSVERTLSIVGQ